MFRLQGRDVVFNVRLESRHCLVDAQIRSLHVMMNVDHVEMASAAAIDEFAEVGETNRCSAVGDSWGCELSLALELVHVLLVYLSGLLGRQVGLAGVVRLVGTKDNVVSLHLTTRGAGVYLREEPLRSTVDRRSRVVDPIVIVEAAINPEGRDKGKGIVQSDGTANSPL